MKITRLMALIHSGSANDTPDSEVFKAVQFVYSIMSLMTFLNQLWA